MIQEALGQGLVPDFDRDLVLRNGDAPHESGNDLQTGLRMIPTRTRQPAWMRGRARQKRDPAISV